MGTKKTKPLKWILMMFPSSYLHMAPAKGHPVSPSTKTFYPVPSKDK